MQLMVRGLDVGCSPTGNIAVVAGTEALNPKSHTLEHTQTQNLSPKRKVVVLT